MVLINASQPKDIVYVGSLCEVNTTEALYFWALWHVKIDKIEYGYSSTPEGAEADLTRAIDNKPVCILGSYAARAIHVKLFIEK